MTRTNRVLAAALAVAAIAAAVTLVLSDDGSPVEQALELVNDDSRFGTATESGVTFGRVSRVLKDAGDGCGDEDAPRCAMYFSAAAWAQIAAVQVLGCTRPGIALARRALRAHLQDMADGDPPDRLPTVPHCE